MLHRQSGAGRSRTFFAALLACLLAFVALPPPPPARAQPPQIPVIPPGQAYRQTNLVSDAPGLAHVLDPLLVRPWGIARSGSDPFWVANAGTNTSTLYNNGPGFHPVAKDLLLPRVNVPGGPTGVVAYAGSGFVFSSGSASGPARFIFATLTGDIAAWNPNVPAAGSDTAVVVSPPPGGPSSRVYTGLALANNGSADLLYAADFRNGKIDVFDSSFNPAVLAGAFADPTLPANFRPYNIQALGGELYVVYAVGGNSNADLLGFPSHGGTAVNVFDFDGIFKRRITFSSNAPASWGLALAPASFGVFSGALLVGSPFDSPSIRAFDPAMGSFLGTPRDEEGEPIFIRGLRALLFHAGDPALYFTAGTHFDAFNLFGSLRATTESATSLIEFPAQSFQVNEDAGHADITVTREGDTSNPATVNYATFDRFRGPTDSTQKGDYELAAGKLTFAPGETSKTFRVLIVDDWLSEFNGTIGLALSNPTGAGVGLGNRKEADLTIAETDPPGIPGNAVDNSRFFVRQHYLDFLNREPDQAGWDFWTHQIDIACNGDPACVRRQRVNVSAAFFLSIEFQETGLLAILAHQAAFGRRPLYGEFMPDTQALQRNFIFGTPGALEQLEANKQAYFNDFVLKPEFVWKYSIFGTDAFASVLIGEAGLDPERYRLVTASLSGPQQVPPNSSTARGRAVLLLSPDQTTARLSLTISGLSSAQTAAHIHGPAANGQDGPVVFTLPNGQFRDFQITLTPAQLEDLKAGRLYVDVHSANFPAGEIRGQLPPAETFRDALARAIRTDVLTRAQALRLVTEAEELKQRHFNSSFVLMQYFGYLRRDPDEAGFNHWLSKLNAHGGDFRRAEMVRAFIESFEYRERFGQ